MNPGPTPFAATPRPPYFAVIFTSRRTDGDQGYGGTAARMVELASRQPGFLGVGSVRGTDGFGITVSYWASLESIHRWKREEEHLAAQENGKRVWYADYQVRVCEVLREYGT
ncbi:MAG: antibiotic biosynthesis monooxygenase, partial [Verrucomicrobiaceae bacterium]